MESYVTNSHIKNIILFGKKSFKYLFMLSGQRHRTIQNWNIFRDFIGPLGSIYLTIQDLYLEKLNFFTYKNISNIFMTMAR